MSDLVPSISDGGDDDIEKAETFLGGLRSELDEGSHLHPSFASLAAAADAIRASYLSFGITPQRAAEAFKMLRILDDNDIEWTVGSSSGTWFRRRQGSSTWQAGPAPLMAEPRLGQVEPWLSAELGEILPSARSSNKSGADTRTGSQAGIRVVDASAISPELERESSDWLLSEWEALETEMEHLQASARPSVSIEDSAAWPVKQMFEKVSKAETNPDRSESLGLPDASEVTGTTDPVSDMFDLFVKPDAPVERTGAVLEADLLEQGPMNREGSAADGEDGDLETSMSLAETSSFEMPNTTSIDSSLSIQDNAPEHDSTPVPSPLGDSPVESSSDQREHAEPPSGDDPYGIGR